MSNMDYDVLDLENKKEKWEDLVRHLNLNARSKQIPLEVTFELTPLCNLDCKMCYVRLDKEKQKSIGKLLTADEWIKIAKEAADEGTLYILFTGGEPFIYPEFIKVYTEVAKMGFMIELYTNGVYLDNDILSALKKYPPAHMSLTLYGSNDEVYEKVTKRKNVFDKIISNYKTLCRELTNTHIGIRTTIIKDNLHDIENMQKVARELNEELRIVIATLKPIRGATNDFENWRISYEDLMNIEKLILENYKSRIKQEVYDERLKYINEEIKYFDNPCKELSIHKDEIKLRCGAARSSCSITWDGKMIPCIMYSEPYTFPVKQGFKAAWEELKIIRDTITIPNKCIGCKYERYCGKCPAFIQAESGSYLNENIKKCNKLKGELS